MDTEEILSLNRKLNDLEQDYLNCKKENTNLRETLKKIREYIKSDNATIGEDYYENIKYLRDELVADNILQIIYETIGDDESETNENS